MKISTSIALKLHAFGLTQLHDPNWTGMDLFDRLKRHTRGRVEPTTLQIRKRDHVGPGSCSNARKAVKHAAEIRKVFADASPKELRALGATLKKIGKRAENLGTGINLKYSSQR
jgi:hypothetical protein